MSRVVGGDSIRRRAVSFSTGRFRDVRAKQFFLAAEIYDRTGREPFREVMLKWHPYGKAIMITGDTREFKEKLKALGGRWNSKQAGWCFPGSKKDDILKELRKLTEVEAINAEDGDAADAPPKKMAKIEKSAPEVKSGAAAAEGAASSGAADGLDEREIALDEKGFKRASVFSYEGKTFVGVREYYKDKQTGEMRPTKKGISLDRACFEKLAENMDKLKALFDEKEGSA